MKVKDDTFEKESHFPGRNLVIVILPMLRIKHKKIRYKTGWSLGVLRSCSATI